MIKGFVKNNLEEYFEMMGKIADVMMGRLECDWFFRAKLESVEVNIMETDEVPNGICCTDRKDHYIVIKVNMAYPQELIELIMAHELAHLLLAKYYALSDYCITDESHGISAIKRSIDGEVYGHHLEESLCDWVAVDVVYRLHEGEISKQRLIEIFEVEDDCWRFTSKSLNLLERLLRIFSTDNSLDFEYYDKVLEDEEFIFPHNELLYAVCSMHLNGFVSEYDKMNGNGAWKKLNDLLELYLMDNSDEEILTRIDGELKRCQENREVERETFGG